MPNPETKTCTFCQAQFRLTPEDLAMYAERKVPPSEKCPTCRFKHLFSFWIFGKFRKITSALSGKTLITVISDQVKFPIYDREEWVSDSWDPLQYGRPYDPSRSFFEQFKELMDVVPHPHQSGVANVNCQWSDDAWRSRECYLSRSFVECEFISYGYRMFGCKNGVDITYCFDVESGYDCTNCSNCYKISHSMHSKNCVESAFLYDCRNVQNSFMCWNLRNKQYCIRNQQYSKEEYFEKVKEFALDSHDSVQKLKEEFRQHIAQDVVHRENQNQQVFNSIGNYQSENKNCYDCGFLEKSENCRHVWRGHSNKDSIDIVGCFNSERSVLANQNEGLYDTIGVTYSSNCRYSNYLDSCENCEYCFGCVGLKNKKYCILNAQYTESEYAKLVEQIKADMQKRGEWGKFFPMTFAMSGYNLSLAHVLFPDTRENTERMGGYWQDLEEPLHDGMETSRLPDRIGDVTDEICKQPLTCPVTKWRFNIAPRELAFYRERSLALPRVHPDVRTLERFRIMTRSMQPYPGTCHYCKKTINCYTDPEANYQKFACIECYQQNIA